MKNLFLERAKHNLRLGAILDYCREHDFDPSRVETFFHALTGVPVPGEGGETWHISQIKHYEVTLTGEYTAPHKVIASIVSFQSSRNGRARYNTLNVPTAKCRKVISHYENEFNREWWQMKEPTAIIDAIEKMINKEGNQMK